MESAPYINGMRLVFESEAYGVKEIIPSHFDTIATGRSDARLDRLR